MFATYEDALAYAEELAAMGGTWDVVLVLDSYGGTVYEVRPAEKGWPQKP